MEVAVRSIRTRIDMHDHLLLRPIADIRQDDRLNYLGNHMMDFIRSNQKIPVRVLRADRYDVWVEGKNNQTYWLPWEVFK